jgi:hypothetical protein
MALLDDALAVSGGLDRWQELESFTLHISITGALLARNGRAGMLKEIVTEGSTREPLLRIWPRPTRSCCFARVNGTPLTPRNCSADPWP